MILFVKEQLFSSITNVDTCRFSKCSVIIPQLSRTTINIQNLCANEHEYSLNFLGLLFHVCENRIACHILLQHFLDLHWSTVSNRFTVYSFLLELHLTDYSSPVLILQLTEMSWNCLRTMRMRRQHGLTLSSSLVKVPRVGNPQKRVV